jgi:hypothetical protein
MMEEIAAAMEEIAAEDSQKMNPVTITLKKICKVKIYTYF